VYKKGVSGIELTDSIAKPMAYAEVNDKDYNLL
jgi:hypothetical protein